jgi:hypothetical protein
MATVASLWVGGPIGLIQKICLSSFVYYGHTTYLYVYDMDMEVPNGIIKLDAAQIIPESNIFYHHGQLAGFSDIFRYKMIMETGQMWVDADTLCLKSNFFDDRDIVFINENNEFFAGGILKLPKNSDLPKALYEKSLELLKNLDGSHWSDLGPNLIDKIMRERSLENYAIPSNKTNVFWGPLQAIMAWDPRHRDEVIEMMNGAECATFFNGGLTMLNFNKNNLVIGSAIEYFYNKFVK